MWTYEGKEITCIEDFPKDCFGFIYLMTHESGKKYIGRKQLQSIRKVKIGKREKEKTKTRKTYKQVIKESNWQDYFSSNDFLKEEANEENCKRVILKFCFNKSQMSYFEAKYLFTYEALEKEEYLNSNIDGRYYGAKLNLEETS